MTTTIRISRETKALLENEGKKGQTFDEIVRDCIKSHYNEKIYNYAYIPYTDNTKIPQFLTVLIPDYSKKITFDKSEVKEAINTIAEHYNIEVEIK